MPAAMTNEEMNARADAIAKLVSDAAGAGETPQDLHGLVFVNVKTLIAELVNPTLSEPGHQPVAYDQSKTPQENVDAAMAAPII